MTRNSYPILVFLVIAGGSQSACSFKSLSYLASGDQRDGSSDSGFDGHISAGDLPIQDTPRSDSFSPDTGAAEGAVRTIDTSSGELGGTVMDGAADTSIALEAGASFDVAHDVPMGIDAGTDAPVTTGGTGGGGATETGGTTSTGGVLGTGGTLGSGGSTGGVPGGGNSGTGGSATVTGGESGTGGTPGSGGSLVGPGGTTASGGSLVGSGGVSGSGGTMASGGTASETGGVSGSGGTMASGGTASGTGGVSGSGGTTASGGQSSTGMVYGVLGQSCSGGLDCPGGTSCCEQMEIPAGNYSMGTNSDPSRSTDEYPEHTAAVDRFFLDKFEVTVGRFRKFVQAFDGTMPPVGSGAHPNPAYPTSGWQVDFNGYMPVSTGDLATQINCDPDYQTWTTSAGVRDTMPMNCISWYLAFAFCVWDGGRLPTEAEWEKAATNGSSNTRFPWGASDPDPAKHAVMNCLADGTSGCAPADLLPVGSRLDGANSWGHLDLAGSLWEWNLDFYDSTYYQSIGTCNNCIDLAGATPRVLRGGDFTSPLRMVRATMRASDPPIYVAPYVGLRCARSP